MSAAADNQIKQVFQEEAQELLSAFEAHLLELAETREPSEILRRIMGVIHTLKGGAMAVPGLDHLVEFAHQLETHLEPLKQGDPSFPTPTLIETLLSCRDHFKHSVDAWVNDRPVPSALAVTLLASVQAQVGESSQGSGHERTWRITFEPPPTVFAQPRILDRIFTRLQALGNCRIEADLAPLPPAPEIDPGRSYLEWTIFLTSSEELDLIKDVFLFVEKGSRLSFTEEATATATKKPFLNLSEATAEEGDATKETARETDSGSVRIPGQRLDKLIGLVSELTTVQTRLSQLAGRISNSDLEAIVQLNERLSSDLRDEVLNLRMLPIAPLFDGLRRQVFEVSRELGKEVEFVIEGGDTELDRGVLEKLREAMTHIVRNAVDHSIEPPGERLAGGKPARGRLVLSAEHIGGNVRIRISDDGRGFDLEAIRRKGEALGMVQPGSLTSEDQVLSMVFLPGFSTAKSLTRVSGRGVGLDVVKKVIDHLQGSIEIQSTPGKGSILSIRLPLTLAIIAGLMVTIADGTYVIPLAQVLECIERPRPPITPLPVAEKGRSAGWSETGMNVRGELVPLIFLRDRFLLEGSPPESEQVVLVRHENRKVGLVVDKVIGHYQTVIKALKGVPLKSRVFSGATLLGDGSVGLIIDIGPLVEAVTKERPAST